MIKIVEIIINESAKIMVNPSSCAYNLKMVKIGLLELE